MASVIQEYESNGVLISKSPLKVGESVTLTYKGLLADHGAEQVIAHIGYGENWDGKDYIPMSFEDGVFKTTFKVALPESLNVCFKDIAENWDNNYGSNYSFKVGAKVVKAKKESDDVAADKKVAAVVVKEPAKKKVEAKPAAAKKATDEAKPARKKKSE